MAVRRGVVLVIVLILVAVAISAAGLIFMGLVVGRSPQVASNSTLVLQVSGDLQEVEPSGVLDQFLEPPPTVRSLVDALRKAKVDRRVSSVIIRPTSTAALWGKVQEVRDAIVDFRQAKKPIIAFLEYGGDQAYYLASACDKVFLLPTASLDLTGIASYELFLRGTLDKIGAFPDALHIGQYKTAANTFTEKSFTAAHKEMAESLNTDLYGQLIRGLADGRHKSEDEVRKLVDHGPYLPEDAVRAGLVDDLAYEDELDDKVELGPRPHPVSRTAELPSCGCHDARPESWTADCGDLCRRHDQQRREQQRLDGQSGRWFRYARSATSDERERTARSARSCCGSTALAGRRLRRTSSGAN